MKYLRLIGMIFLLAMVCAACQPAVSDPEVIVVTSETVVEVVVTATPETVSEVLPSPTTAEESVVVSEVEGDWIDSGEALEHVGETAKVRIEQAQCSFRANVNGSPTFCNDQPYPDHEFTFLIWGKDLSHFDGACMIVEGEIELYEGKAEIVVEDETHVWACP